MGKEDFIVDLEYFRDVLKEYIPIYESNLKEGTDDFTYGFYKGRIAECKSTIEMVDEIIAERKAA